MIVRTLVTTFALVTLIGCASQAPQQQVSSGGVSSQKQLQAQQQLSQQRQGLGLKRKIAVGRLSNETNYGRSLLRETVTGVHDQKISDMFTQAIVNTNQFLIFERQDLASIKAEQNLTGISQQLVGVDTLVIGSLTEFGRNTTGERGFVSSSNKQEATATVDLRLVDVASGQVIASVSGSGSSSLEQSRTLGFGSVAGYDGSLNDIAIGAAVNAAVENMLNLLLEKPWTADILAQENDQVFISGGASQGVKAGMIFDVMTKGQQVYSATMGSNITLPGQKIAELEVTGTFGTDVMNQGAIGVIRNGSIAGLDLKTLEVRE